jgi:hypothetical protein
MGGFRTPDGIRKPSPDTSFRVVRTASENGHSLAFAEPRGSWRCGASDLSTRSARAYGWQDGVTDKRRGFDGLARQMRHVLGQDPRSASESA